jgi:hypothetical protein
MPAIQAHFGAGGGPAPDFDNAAAGGSGGVRHRGAIPAVKPVTLPGVSGIHSSKSCCQVGVPTKWHPTAEGLVDDDNPAAQRGSI